MHFFCYIHELFYRKEYRSCRSKKKGKKSRKKKERNRNRKAEKRKQNIKRREDNNNYIVDRNVTRKPEKLGAYYFGCPLLYVWEEFMRRRKKIYILDSRFIFVGI